MTNQKKTVAPKKLKLVKGKLKVRSGITCGETHTTRAGLMP
jgi:hypothetical protein